MTDSALPSARDATRRIAVWVLTILLTAVLLVGLAFLAALLAV
jgi:hypothetical protein